MIENPTSLKLLTYFPVEVLSDDSVINKYLNYRVNENALISSLFKFKKTGSSIRSVEKVVFNIRTFKPKFLNEKNMLKFRIEQEKLKREIKDAIDIGDMVYALIVRNNNCIYTDFVICDHLTKHVVWNNLFYNVRNWK